MKRLKWIVGSAARQFGWPGLAGCVLLIFSVVIVVARVLPLQQKISFYLSAVQSVKTTGNFADVAKPALAWDAYIPLRTELNTQLLEFRSVAEQSALDIRASDYRLTKVDGTSLWRYQMDFLLETNYVSVQRFIAQLLNTMPNLALKGVDITRVAEVEGQVMANLRFVFYFRQN